MPLSGALGPNRSAQHVRKEVVLTNLPAFQNQLQAVEFLALRVGIAQRRAWGKRCVKGQSVQPKLAYGVTRCVASGYHGAPDARPKQQRMEELPHFDGKLFAGQGSVIMLCSEGTVEDNAAPCL